MGRLSESARQAAVLEALRMAMPAGDMLDARQPCWPAVQLAVQHAQLKTDAAGLQAYQRNAQATAQRVLASTYPTVAAMLGEEALDALALILWTRNPPYSGDLGEWGGALPDLIAAHPDLQAWPWLADSARLDWARHVAERAANTTLDAGSLHLLGTAAPDQVCLWLKPCVQVLASNWPIAGLWAAHQLPAEQQAPAAEQALSQAQAGTVIVWRHPWALQMHSLADAQAAWMARLADPTAGAPPPLSRLLDEAQPDFDFAAWLSQAVSLGWLWRVTTPS
ncbi:MAG: DNA-binding domain-containing protein [Aquabacterium sp.]